MLAFIAAELLIGGVLGEIVVGRMLSINTNFLLQGLLNLAGFAAGGFLIGVVSPGRRIAEPAIGAAATLVLVSILTVFVPFRYMGYSRGSLVVAAVVAAAIAAGGAYLGEKLTGNVADLPGQTQRRLRG